jgi:hypothetical protein
MSRELLSSHSGFSGIQDVALAAHLEDEQISVAMYQRVLHSPPECDVLCGHGKFRTSASQEIFGSHQVMQNYCGQKLNLWKSHHARLLIASLIKPLS